MGKKLVRVLKTDEVVAYIKHKRENSIFSQGFNYQTGYLDGLENLEMDIKEGKLTSYLFDGSQEDVIL